MEHETIDVAVDPRRFPAIRGRTCTLFVVEAKTEEQWLLDPGLVDARTGGPQGPHEFPEFGGIEDCGFRVRVDRVDQLDSSAGPCYVVNNATKCIGLGHAYDVVFDCDNDEWLWLGDFIDDGGTEEAG